MTTKTGIIKKIHSMLKSKEASCREITQKYLDAIHKSELNAYVNICTETALKTADTVDKKIQNGKKISPLAGVPMALKDLVSTEGIETTCCSKILEGYVPIFNATVWELLKNQDAVLLGKNNMDEFAMGSSGRTSCCGPAKNPHNLDHMPGGSSSGPAAAVAGNIAAYSLGSDTGGSIRQPASLCGIVGVKPTYGAVSRYGAVALASSFDQIGQMAKTVEDVSLVFDTIAKHDPKDSTSRQCHFNTADHLNRDIKGLKVGLPKELFENINPEVKKSVEDAIKSYESMGAQVDYFDFPEVKYSLPVYYVLQTAEASSNLSRFDGIRYGYKAANYKDINDMICKTRSEGFGKEVKRRILLGNYVLSSGFYDAYYNKAQNLRNLISNKFNEAFEQFDVLIAPTSPVTAPRLDCTYTSPEESYMADICTVPANIAGIPSISIPCGFDSKNLPIGLQLFGPKFSESKLFNAAHQFELFTNFAHVHDLNMGVAL